MARAKTKPRAKKPKRTPAARPEHLLSARFVPPATIKLAFDDASFSLPIKRLEMPLERLRWTTVRAAPTGDALTVRAVKGELIHVSSESLRYLVDKRYAAKVDATLKSVQLTRDELAALSRDNPPPPEWLSEPARDLRSESWK